MPSSMQENMPNPFKKNANTFGSSSDRLAVRRAQTLFRNVPVTSPVVTNTVKKSDGNVYSGPVFLNNGKFLGAVGGFNVNPYALRQAINTGKAFEQSECAKVTIAGAIQDISINNPNDTCWRGGSCAPINTSYNLYEGPFLLKRPTLPQDASACYSLLVQKQYIFDPSNIVVPTPFLTEVLASNDKFANLTLDSRTCMSK